MISRRSALGIAFAGIWLLVAAPARADSVKALVKKADRILRGSTSAAVMRMDIKTKSYSRSYKMVIWDDSSSARDKTLVKILGPTSWRGYATLKLGNTLKIYDPKTNHVQAVGKSMLGDSWMGSHFSNDDLVKETQLAVHYDATSLGSRKAKNELGDEATFWKISLTPKPTAPVVWGRIVFEIWERGDTVMPVRSDYYGKPKDKTPTRTMRFFGVKELGGRLVPSEMEVTVADKPGEHTRITYEKLRFDVKIPASKFSEQAMR
jgi:Outer membrane lipoprotein-sorting protein